jgi:hypothetical protein
VKAEEAKLIKARQEGSREALEIIGELRITKIDSPDHSKGSGSPMPIRAPVEISQN